MASAPGPLRPLHSLLGWLLVLGLVASLCAVSGTAQAAKPDRPSQDLPVIPQRCSVGYPYLNPDIRPCPVDRFRRNRPTVVLWGDSHALQMMPAVKKAVAGRGVNFAMFSLGSCPPLKYDRAGKNAQVTCKRFNADALDYVARLKRRQKPVRVILGGHWQAYRWLHRGLFVTGRLHREDYPHYVVEIARVFPQRSRGLFARLGRMGVDVDVIGQTATVPDRVRRCGRGEKPYVCNLARKQALPNETATKAWVRTSMRRLRPGARLIDPNRAYCNARMCKGFKDGIYTFFNDLHISATRAATLARFFRPSIKALARRAQ